MSKNYEVVCLTCREDGFGQLWKLNTENQANHIKNIHESTFEGHNARVTFTG